MKFRSTFSLSAMALCLVFLSSMAELGAATLNWTVDSTQAVTYSADSTVWVTCHVTVTYSTLSSSPSYRAGRRYCIIISAASVSPTANPALNYTAWAPNYAVNQLFIGPNPSTLTQVLSGNFPSGTANGAVQNFSFDIALANSTFPNPGAYTISLTEKLWPSCNSFPTLGGTSSTKTQLIAVTVPNSYDVSVVPTGGSFSATTTSQPLDFGTLTAGATLGADILVRSNVSYSLALTSPNMGALSNGVDTVPYILKQGVNTKSLTTGSTTLVSGALKNNTTVPAKYAITATIGTLGADLSSGTYTDNLTVTLTAP
jgi:hypothetical protein